MKKKILFVVDERQMGGVSTVLQDMLHHLDKKRFDIELLVLHDRGDQLENLPRNIKVRYGNKYFMGIDYTLKEAIKSNNIEVIYHKLNIVCAMKTKRIIKAIKRQRVKMNLPKYDVEVAFKDGFTALFTAAGDTKHKIHWLHYEYHECNPNAKYNSLFTQILPLFQVIVGVSQKVLDAFNSLYQLADISVVIPNIIDTNKIIEACDKEVSVILKDDVINFVCVGRLHNVKGYQRLLHILALPSMEKNNTLYHIDIYGDGPEEAYLQQIIIENKLENVVTLKGRVDNPYPIIKKYDASLVVSHFEAFGLSIVESMILQVPVLATRTAAVDELIENGKNGIVCSNDEESIQQMITNIAHHENVLIEMKKQLENYHYDNEEIVNKIEILLSGGQL